jgi:FAD/FMN-containing dehydrogenase
MQAARRWPSVVLPGTEEVGMTAIAAERTEIERLRETFGVRLLDQSADGYDAARRVHNGLVDRRPALIARCSGVADVLDALRFARESELEIAIRGGGHSIAGLSTVDDGIVIDLSLMKGVHVDPVARAVRAQPGVTWGELDRETALFELAVTGGTVSTTGIAGLTLGGGFGWLMGSHGLTVDNLESAQVVTVDGRILTASASANDDLFWAIRGGGGNFGVVTSLEYRLHPVSTITGGLVAHAFEEARDVLCALRDFAAAAPDELGLVGALVHAPDGSGVPLAAFAMCHGGEPSEAEHALGPILSFGSPVMSQVGPMPYPDVNRMLDGAYPAGALNYWKSSFLGDLSDEAIDVLVTQFARSPSPMTVVAIECFHGAVTRVAESATAVPHREPGFNALITSVWTDPRDTEKNVEWTRRVYADLEPFFRDRRYVNYLSEDDGDAARAAFGPNYERLSEVKRRFDPDNLLRRNLNIRPAVD